MKECDKNIGIAIVPNQIYNSLVISHLSNTSIYLPLFNDPLESTSLNIKESLELLLFNKDISKRLYNNLLVKNPKIGKFRILPKLHKSKFSCRPIINCVDHPTSLICLFIDVL